MVTRVFTETTTGLTSSLQGRKVTEGRTEPVTLKPALRRIAQFNKVRKTIDFNMRNVFLSREKLSSISRHELAEVIFRMFSYQEKNMKPSAERKSASCVLIDGCGLKGVVPEESLDCDSL